MNIALNTVLALVCCLILCSCADLSPRLSLRDTPPPDLQLPLPTATSTEGAIFAADSGLSLFEDPKARNVGDLVTIQLVENTTAQKKADTKTSKESDVNLGDVRLFGKPLNIATGATGTRSFTGSGDSSQSNSLAGSVSAVVVKRYPNGILQIRGEKQIELNQGSEVVYIDGWLRAADVRADNTVTSDRIGNARLTYKGRGAIADSNAQGWLSRFFNSPWFPF